MTCEDAVRLVEASQIGESDATDMILQASQGIDAEIVRFNKIRRYYISIIVVLVIIDAIIQLL
ncbi:MAG: hypothetical protein ACTSYL_01040 [Candidatus Thorarchaeota archaeon]